MIENVLGIIKTSLLKPEVIVLANMQHNDTGKNRLNGHSINLFIY